MQNINTEAIFYSGSSTTKGGHKITLQVTDRETIEVLEAIGAGKRYMLALVPLTDDDQPDEVPKPKRHWNDMRLSQQAGILCGDERFWDFLSITFREERGFIAVPRDAAEVLRAICSITSRAELDTNPEAAERFKRLMTDFDAYTGRIGR